MNVIPSREDFEPLLRWLVTAYGPPGQEEEIRDLCACELEKTCDLVATDRCGNLIGSIHSPRAQSDEPPLVLMAHLDEIAMMVSRIDETGMIQVTKLGGARPMSFGQTPVEILGNRGLVTGILSLGSMHAPPEPIHIRQEETDRPGWNDLFVLTGLAGEQLAEKGVEPGCRIVVHKRMRQVLPFNSLIAAPFMDDRALLCGGILAMQAIAQRKSELARDVYFVCTVKEEVTNTGALYALRGIGDCDLVALEVGPVLHEYGTILNGDPIIPYSDMKSLYSKPLADSLRQATKRAGLEPQAALFENFASDASAALAIGQVARAAAFCIPTENTHGFEIIHGEAVPNLVRTIAAFALESSGSGT